MPLITPKKPNARSAISINPSRFALASCWQVLGGHLPTRSKLTVGCAFTFGSLVLDQNDWAIDCQHLGRDLLSLECGLEIDYRGPIGTIVDYSQPQRRIARVARCCGRDVVSLPRVGLGAEAGRHPAV